MIIQYHHVNNHGYIFHFSFSDTVAGVGIGMLILGVVLGVVFAYLALTRTVRRPKAPFHDDGEMDEFQDDPEL